MSEWGSGDLSLEKLKIHARLEAIESSIREDKEDTKSFRVELKEMMRTQHTIIFGDGEAKKGLVTRVQELETVRGIHSKIIWGIGLPSLALMTKTVYDWIVGKRV